LFRVRHWQTKDGGGMGGAAEGLTEGTLLKVR
jgi:hypothetical protein